MNNQDGVTAWLDRVVAWAEAVSRVGVWAGGVVLLAAVAMIVIEVVVRWGFGLSLRGAHEISGYVLAVITAWSLAYALFQKAHIRIDVAYVRFGPRVRAVLDVFALAILAAFLVVMLGQTYLFVEQTIVRGSTANTPLATPLWIPRTIWFAGLVWFALAVFLVLLRILVAAIRGERDTVHRLVGSRTLGEEIREVQTETAVSAKSGDDVSCSR